MEKVLIGFPRVFGIERAKLREILSSIQIEPQLKCDFYFHLKSADYRKPCRGCVIHCLS